MNTRTLLTIETAADIARSVVEYALYISLALSTVGFGIATGWLG